MKLLSVIYFVLHLSTISAFEVKPKPKNQFSTKSNSYYSSAKNIECIHMESSPGELYFKSEGTPYVCGLYLVSPEPDQRVEISFYGFDISCENGGLLAVVDGWEAQGEFFPSDLDSTAPVEDRYRTYCGKDRPKRITATLNAVLIQFRIPAIGEGFHIRVDFRRNPTPCNMISMANEGEFTLHNFGKEINCSFSIIEPQRITILSLDVGVSKELPMQTRDTGYLEKCQRRGGSDYVQLLNGDGLDPSFMWLEGTMCGLASKPAPQSFYLGCKHSVVRLVSSGRYFNSVTFQHSPLTDEELELLKGLEC